MEKKKKYIWIVLLIILISGVTGGYLILSTSNKKIVLQIESNIEEADLFISEEKVGEIKDYKIRLENIQLKKSDTIYAVKAFETGDDLSNRVKVSDIPKQGSLQLDFNYLNKEEQQEEISQYFNQLSSAVTNQGEKWSSPSKVKDESEKNILAIIERYASFIPERKIEGILFGLTSLENGQWLGNNLYQADLKIEVSLQSENEKVLKYDVPGFVYEFVDEGIIVQSFDTKNIKGQDDNSVQFLAQEQLIVKQDTKGLAKNLGMELYPELFEENEFHELADTIVGNDGEVLFLFPNKSQVSGKVLKVKVEQEKAIIKFLGTSNPNGNVDALFEYDLLAKKAHQIEETNHPKYIFSSSDLLNFVLKETVQGPHYRFQSFNNEDDNKGVYSLPNKEEPDGKILYKAVVSQVDQPTHLSQEVHWMLKEGKVYSFQNGHNQDWQEYDWVTINQKKKELKESDVYGTWLTGDKVLHLKPESMSYGIQNSGVGFGGGVVSTNFDEVTKLLTVQTHAPASAMNPKEYNDVLEIQLSVSNSGEIVLIYDNQIFWQE